MAVKQNNTEGNNSSADASQVNAATGVKSTGTITKSKKMIGNGSASDTGGGGGLSSPGGLGVTSNADLPGCSGSKGAFSKAQASMSGSGAMPGNGKVNNGIICNDLPHILQYIEALKQRQHQYEFRKDWYNKFYRQLIILLSRVPLPRKTPEALKLFKEDISKIETFLAKNEKHIYYQTYLPVVCQLIALNDGETPSVALAVVFQLFSPDMIEEAVQSLLDRDVPDQSISRTVSLLCEWLRICNFCQNLNVWILAILNGLLKQQKTALMHQIALDNVEQLFLSLIIPWARPKVSPVFFYMLSLIDQTPEIFHKLILRFPSMVSGLKKQAESSEDYAESTKAILQQIVDRASELMVRFYRFDDLYEPVEAALREFPPSSNCMSYGYGNAGPYSGVGESGLTTAQNTNAKVGLVNLGNTCYMNSVLQALAMTKEFSREILLTESKSPLLLNMQRQIALMLYSTRQELTPSTVLRATRPPGFSPGLQQDSSEFLGYLLETLHEEEMAFRKYTLKKSNIQKRLETTGGGAAAAICSPKDLENDEEDEDEEDLKENQEDSEVVMNISSNVSNNISTNAGNAVNMATQEATQDNNGVSSTSTIAIKDGITPSDYFSTIEKTFTGKLATTYKCLTCGWKSCNTDSFRDLQLSFPDVKNDCASNYSVQDLIEYYCSPEKLYGDNQYFCERCRKLSDAERYINVISAPKNLILTLKHFKYDQKYHMRAKLMHKVFHDEKVSLKVCSSDSLEETATVHYDIYAGVVHSGFSMDSGHYYTYAADATNKWYKFNDSVVTLSRTEELHNLTPPNTPYILFYQMGSRSNETAESQASSKAIKVDVPSPLTLEELPRELRDIVSSDNSAFAEEVKMRLLKSAKALSSMNSTMKPSNMGGRRDSYDDDDDEDPAPTSGCGGNSLANNINRFVY